MSLQVAPEIEARVRDLAAARGQSVDAVLDEVLRLLQKRNSPPPARRVEPTDSSLEMACIAQPNLRYVNQWVVLNGSEVVAHGVDAKAPVAEACAKGVTTPCLHFVHEPSPDPLFVGWLGTEIMLRLQFCTGGQAF